MRVCLCSKAVAVISDRVVIIERGYSFMCVLSLLRIVDFSDVNKYVFGEIFYFIVTFKSRRIVAVFVAVSLRFIKFLLTPRIPDLILLFILLAKFVCVIMTSMNLFL